MAGYGSNMWTIALNFKSFYLKKTSTVTGFYHNESANHSISDTNLPLLDLNQQQAATGMNVRSVA